MSANVLINGKFYNAGFTAVHRVADELIHAFDRLNDPAGSMAMELILPPVSGTPPKLSNIGVRRGGALYGQAWEQIDLPLLGRKRVLVNLCNLAPVMASPAITLIHDAQVFSTPESYSRLFATWYRTVYRGVGRRHQLVTVSRFSASELERHGVCDAAHIKVIHNGVDHMLRVTPEPEVLAKHDLVAGGYVLALANLFVHKNLGVLLKAFARSEMAHIKLALFGPADRAAIEAAGHVVPPNVVLLGRISDGELRALMESALCLASPSLTEGFGLPALEAMLLGTPAVIAPCGAQPEVCGSAALTAPPNEPEAWANAILNLIDKPAERAGRVDAGRRHARNFTWDRAARDWLSIIRIELAHLRKKIEIAPLPAARSVLD